MFSKTFFLTVLFCAVVYANAAPEPQHLRIRREAGDKVKAFIAEQDRKIREFTNKVKDALVSFWNRITGKESAEKQRQINELQASLEEVQERSANNLRETQAKYSQLLAQQQAKLLEVNERNRDLLERQAKLLADLQAEADKELDIQINEYDQEINNLTGRLEKVLNE